MRLKFKHGIKRRWTLAQLEGYMRTFSALHAYHLSHPEDKALEKDVVKRFLDNYKNELGEEFDVEWPLVLMMVKKVA